MDQPTVDDEGGVRRERVEPVAKRNVRDALHIGVEVPMKYMIGMLIVGAFNAGMIWFQYGALVKSAEKLQISHEDIKFSLAKIDQKNTQQDEKLNDHETRLRTVERTSKP